MPRAFSNDVWSAIATYFKDEPWVMGYELANEPLKDQDSVPEWTDAFWREKMLNCIQVVREIDTKHIVFVNSRWWTHLYAIENNWGAIDFEVDEPYKNAIFSQHDYSRVWCNPTAYGGAYGNEYGMVLY